MGSWTSDRSYRRRSIARWSDSGKRAQPRRGPRLFSVELILDATGVGLPIGDMLRERGLAPRLVLFTGSDTVNQQPQGVVSVGKAWMVGRMQVLLQSRRMRLPRTVEAAILARELQEYQITVNEHAHASFNAKVGSHDDLVISLGLSCGIEQSAERATSRRYVDGDPDLTRDQQRGQWNRTRRRLAERWGGSRANAALIAVA